jgi:hypothetical protein
LGELGDNEDFTYIQLYLQKGLEKGIRTAAVLRLINANIMGSEAAVIPQMAPTWAYARGASDLFFDFPACI